MGMFYGGITGANIFVPGNCEDELWSFVIVDFFFQSFINTKQQLDPFKFLSASTQMIFFESRFKNNATLTVLLQLIPNKRCKTNLHIYYLSK